MPSDRPADWFCLLTTVSLVFPCIYIGKGSGNMAYHFLTQVLAALLTSWLAEVQAVADVTAPAGRVVGLELDVLGTTVHAFLGVPFARPPVGPRRFRRAEPMEPWGGTYNATRKPSACIQDLAFYGRPGSIYNTWTPNGPISEDCLYLNVWRPTPVPTRAAVLVWIYGGSFQVGSSTVDLYDGKYLAAAEGVVVVTVNYRVSTLGFLYTPSGGAPGNMGLTDQAMALTWVKENIASFGGDPNLVTLVGESAGGVSVGYLQMSPGTRDLFSRGIVQSGSVVMPWGRDSAAVAYNKTVRFAESVRVGCREWTRSSSKGADAILDCLRDKDAGQLVDTSVLRDTSFFPVVDGSFLVERPEDALAGGNFKKMDLLIGSNTNEPTLFFIEDLPGFSSNADGIITKEQFISGLKFYIPWLNEFAVDALVYQYTAWLHHEEASMYRDAFDLLYGDFFAFCPDVTAALAHVKQGSATYMYQFAHRPSNSVWPDWAGVVHGAEMAFVFGWPLDAALGYTLDEIQLSRRIMRHWANFARTGNPNNNNEVTWRAFDLVDGGYTVLDAHAPRMKTGPRFAACAFWENYVKPLTAKTDALMTSQSCDPATSDAQVRADSKAKFWLLYLILSSLSFLYYFALHH
ncbi:PREDICTED: cholinesterase 1-like [Branchiostoma belcheri]|uniref:Carboxylic ester hydrolase n=1 Tax=Branchiostoma belcheri TaxID=7741 RepID=A0A6P4ZC59_BRABE|nr:PREDICTED: cholinesterase 1-like [Branchiostoma belcheri]